MEDQILDTILFDLCCNFTLKVLDFVYEYDLRQEVNAGDGRLCLIAEIDIFFWSSSNLFRVVTCTLRNQK